MRNRNFFKRADWVVWTILALAPLIAYYLALRGGIDTPFVTYLEQFVLYVNNPIYDGLSAVFGVDGLLPVMTVPMLAMLTNFVIAGIAHLFVDFMLSIPRMAHELLNGLFDVGD